MDRATFEWDKAKAAANLAKHGIGFGDALSAFEDPLSITIPDPDHSMDEHRFILLGENRRGRLIGSCPNPLLAGGGGGRAPILSGSGRAPEGAQMCTTLQTRPGEAIMPIPKPFPRAGHGRGCK